MGYSTKAIIRKDVSLKEIAETIGSMFKDIEIKSTHTEDYFYIVFQYGSVYYSLDVFTNTSMIESDCNIVGKMVSINQGFEKHLDVIKMFVDKFGGYVSTNNGEDFEAVNIEEFENSKDVTEEDKLVNKIAKEFGFVNIDKVLDICNEYLTINI